MTQAFAQRLWGGVTTGYGKTTAGIAYDSPDGEMLRNLQNNVYAFSAAKNWQQMKALTQALIGDDDKLRTYSQFKNAAFQINDSHVNQWLKTEYDTAIASGQMASTWVDIKNNSSTTMLQFDAVMDGHTSAICSSLNGVIRPVDDAFWKQYYPPNHFGCRSTVRQRSSGKATPEANIVYPEKVPPMFKVNLADRGLAFPPAHPYWIGIPKKELNNALLLMPEQNQYRTIYKGKTGSLSLHLKTEAEGKEDLNDLLLIGNELAQKERHVKILPEIHIKEPELRAKLLPGMKERKNCDLLIDNEYWEHEKPTTPLDWEKLQNRIRNGNKQANRVIIQLTENYDINIIKELANERFRNLPNLEELMFRTFKGKYIEFSK